MVNFGNEIQQIDIENLTKEQVQAHVNQVGSLSLHGITSDGTYFDYLILRTGEQTKDITVAAISELSTGSPTSNQDDTIEYTISVGDMCSNGMYILRTTDRSKVEKIFKATVSNIAAYGPLTATQMIQDIAKANSVQAEFGT